MKRYAIIIPFFAVFMFHSLITQAQQWSICGYLPSNPGPNPTVCVVNGSYVWIAGGPVDTPRVYRTINGGTNWDQLPTTGMTKEIYCLWATNTTTAFVGEGNMTGNARLFKTVDAGENWSVVLTTNPNQGFFNGIMFARNNVNRGTGIALAERIYKTVNNGLTWTMEQSGVVGVSNAHNSLMVVDQFFYGFGMNNGAARVRITTNSGGDWLNQAVNLTGHYTSAIGFNDNKLIGLAATSTSMPMYSRTTDGGFTWTPLNIDTGVTGNCFIKWVSETSVVYILGFNGAFKKSIDNGQTWTQMSTAGIPNIYHFDVEKINAVVYGYAVSTNGTVLKLVDSVLVILGNEKHNTVPKEYSLEQNYPNPFNPVTTIKYSVPKNNINVKLAVYDLLGKEVALIVNETKQAGNYEVTFDGNNLSSGMYFYKMQAGMEFTAVKKMILVK
jgi:photosystem II stability/assembly factor-like uncharacterized protein